MIVSFEEFLDIAQKDEATVAYLATDAQASETMLQLSGKAKTFAETSGKNKLEQLAKSRQSHNTEGRRKTRVLFGRRTGEGLLDVRFSTNRKLIALVESMEEGITRKVSEEEPTMGEIARACARDIYSAPFLLSTSTDLMESNVWIDEGDATYVRDCVKELAMSVQAFASDLEESDEAKRQMFYKIVPAGIAEGIMGSADEICNKGTIVDGARDLDAGDIRHRIQSYNHRVEIYERIVQETGLKKEEEN